MVFKYLENFVFLKFSVILNSLESIKLVSLWYIKTLMVVLTSENPYNLSKGIF